MDGTVISGPVNLASRIEGLTKLYGDGILISEVTLVSLDDPDKYQYRVRDRVRVKGKKEAVSVIEIFNGQSETTVELHLKTKLDF